MNRICHICFVETEDDYLCDTCDEYYCDDCSYTFTLYYQFQGSRCHFCSDQKRLKPISKGDILNNKINYILNSKY